MEIRQLEHQVVAIKSASTTAAGLAEVIDKTFPALFGELASRGIEPAGPPLVRYLKTGEHMDVELGVPVAPDTTPAVRTIVLPAGPTAVFLYVGAYEGIRDAWQQFGDWIGRQGREQDGPFWESYVTDPRTEPDPSRRLTELCVPVK